MPDLATDPSDLAAAKKRARNDARDVRAEAKATTGPLAGNLLQAQFLDNVPMPPNGVVAGYWPMNDEMNPVPLLKRLIKDGVQCALPAVVAKAKALEFRDWQPDVALEDGPFGTSHPPASADVTSPIVSLRRIGLSIGIWGWILRSHIGRHEIVGFHGVGRGDCLSIAASRCGAPR